MNNVHTLEHEIHLINEHDDKIENFDLKLEENQPIKIFYAGLLGIAQGVYELCEKIDLNGLNIELHLFGDGAEKSQIEALISSEKGKNIFFHGMMERNDLHEKLKTFDIAIVPLKVRIYGSVPSKIFEYGALGFPILYFGGGEGETIVEENNMGWIASVENYEQLNHEIQKISKMSKSELFEMKKGIFIKSEINFNLDNQMNYLIEKEVF
jgi:glycosyltransferase involved in cell wall biosynthesis